MAAKDPKEIFSDNLKYYRRLAGYSQEQLATASQVKRHKIGSYEERRVMAPVREMIKLAAALNISMQTLLQARKPISSVKDDEKKKQLLYDKYTTLSKDKKMLVDIILNN